MDTEPTQEQLQEWWNGLSEAARTALVAHPDAAIPEEQLDEVMSYENGITTFARWDRGLRIVHLRTASRVFVASLG